MKGKRTTRYTRSVKLSEAIDFYYYKPSQGYLPNAISAALFIDDTKEMER